MGPLTETTVPKVPLTVTGSPWTPHLMLDHFIRRDPTGPYVKPLPPSRGFTSNPETILPLCFFLNTHSRLTSGPPSRLPLPTVSPRSDLVPLPPIVPPVCDKVSVTLRSSTVWVLPCLPVVFSHPHTNRGSSLIYSTTHVYVFTSHRTLVYNVVRRPTTLFVVFVFRL